ncbi:transcriptional regulator [Cohnella sp. CFH 77786]|uniref:Nif3-like dinuclear metal center hexameric protein n=1 Tax=Cohnella sp. CFH 77786 TaxID=2662265 RepID=UPI001C609700|nr:Nif3-like dinuclear metal center hexameric protein [Cohnella sp. CFH 77786]MBW5445341.1 transcriptional regulator [Cohnella sp. CFH 77786]
MRPTVQSVIDALIEPAGGLERTVDALLFGKPQTEVTGIAVSFMPTQRVLEQTIERGANLLITHEGPFFSHQDGTGLRMADSVFKAKKRFIEESGLAIFRFHDYWHRYRPDGIMEGLIHALGWEPYVLEHREAAAIVRIPAASVREVAEYAKRRLGIPYVRAIGDLDMKCKKLGLLAGYRGGGDLSIPLLGQEDVDLILCGEGPEWETPEYVRDSNRLGNRKALIVLGHAESEEPGMKLLADRLQTKYPGIPVHFLKEEPVFRVI